MIRFAHRGQQGPEVSFQRLVHMDSFTGPYGPPLQTKRLLSYFRKSRLVCKEP